MRLLNNKQIGQSDNNNLKVIIPINILKYLMKILTNDKFTE